MTGLRVLQRKEWLESWRTLRTPIVGGLFVLVGLTSPLLAKYLPEIIKAAGGDQFPTGDIPTPVLADAVSQLWKNLAQFGAFAAIILAMGSVSGELDRGTAAFVLSKTASRGAFLAAKVGVIAAVLGLATILAVGLGLVLHRRPVRAAVDRGLARPGRARLAGPVRLGGDHLPRQHRDGFHGRGGRDRVRRPSRAVRSCRPSPAWRRSCRADWRHRRSRSPPARRSTGSTCCKPVVSTVILIAVALGVAAWSFRRREL